MIKLIAEHLLYTVFGAMAVACIGAFGYLMYSMLRSKGFMAALLATGTIAWCWAVGYAMFNGY